MEQIMDASVPQVVERITERIVEQNIDVRCSDVERVWRGDVDPTGTSGNSGSLRTLWMCRFLKWCRKFLKNVTVSSRNVLFS